MEPCRKVPFITFVVSPYKKAKLNLSGCNFNCKGCFAIAKQETGRTLSVGGLLNLFIKSSQFIYGEIVDDVQMTGGEPTANIDYLLSLIRRLRELNVNKIGISTNGHLLDRNLVEELRFLGVDYIKLDLKAYTDKVHRWYTGESNVNVLKAIELLNQYGFNFYVRTIFIPAIMDFDEIEKIAKFLSQISSHILYKIYQFAPEQLDTYISRAPTQREMLRAFKVAKRYLKNVEFFTTSTAYKPDPYRYVEVRADELFQEFKRIDRISRSIIETWDMRYLTMNQILNTKAEVRL